MANKNSSKAKSVSSKIEKNSLALQKVAHETIDLFFSSIFLLTNKFKSVLKKPTTNSETERSQSALDKLKNISKRVKNAIEKQIEE